MEEFLLALQFLTIIPVKTKKIDENKLSLSAAYFPIIGLILGLILVAINSLLSFVSLKQFPIDVILIISLIILTGGLHLDGLADTFDALSSRKDKFEMLKIMRDSRIGAMGALSLISIILLKLSLLFSLSLSIKNAALILMCVLSRYSLVLLMLLFPYAREEGKARDFIKGMNFKIFLTATIISLIASIIILELKGLFTFIMVGIFVILLGKFIAKKIGGMTGDTLGAINELTEVFVLLNILILSGGYI